MINIVIWVLTRSSSRIISAIPGLISQSSELVFGSRDAIVIGSSELAADKNGGMHFELLQLEKNEHFPQFIIS